MFNIGNRVNIISGCNAGSSGVIMESKICYDNEMEYRVRLDGEKEDIIYFEHNLEAENILDQEIHPLGEWTKFIPDNADRNTFFEEMAEIYPKYNKDHNIKNNKFKVCVFEGNEGPIPHVHVYFDQKGENNHGSTKTVAYICLATSEYAPQHKDETKVLNSHERKALVEYFNTKIPNSYGQNDKGEFYQKTCWQACVEHWISENDGSEKYFEFDDETRLYTMPDYTKLSLS